MGLLITEFDKVYDDHIQALNDPKLRKEYQDLCFDLHLPCPSAYWTLETSIKNKVIETKRQPAGSWTRNFWNAMAMSELSINCNAVSPNFGAGYLTLKQYNGTISGSTTTIISIRNNHYAYNGYMGVADATFGILVGTSNSAFSLEDYTMGALIGHGTGAGQLSYQSMIAPTITWTQGTLTMTVSRYRYFNNNTANSITVEEVGLVLYKNGFILTERHLTGGLAVPATAQLKCTYDISMVYPS